MACGAIPESLPVLNAGDLVALLAYEGLGQIVFGSNRDRHCERSEAIQGNVGRPRSLDCFVAALLAMTIPSERCTLRVALCLAKNRKYAMHLSSPDCHAPPGGVPIDDGEEGCDRPDLLAGARDGAEF